MSRLIEIDQMKGWLIFLVVFGHFIERFGLWRTDYSFILKVIYAHHMPVFALVAGIFHRNEKVLKRVINLAILLCVCQLMYLLAPQTAGFTMKFIYTPYWILWFLLALIFWTALTPIIDKCKFGMLIVILLFFFIRLLHYNGYPLSWMRTLYFFVFYYFGFKYGLLLLSHTKNYFWKKVSVYIFVLIVLLNTYLPPAFLYGSFSQQAINMGIFEFLFDELLVLIYSLLSFVVMGGVFQAINSQVIALVGRNSLGIYIFHGFAVIYLVNFTMFLYPNISLNIKLMWSFILSIATCYIAIYLDIGNKVNFIVHKISVWLKLIKE